MSSLLMKYITRKSWLEISDLNIVDSTILLDIDGVLMADGEDSIRKNILSYVEELLANNDIWIVSNTFDDSRKEHVGKLLNARWVDTHLKKPSKKILDHIERDPRKPLVVIGDKLITDGWFAHRIGAQGLIIKDRLVSKHDSLVARVSYMLDDVVSGFLKF